MYICIPCFLLPIACCQPAEGGQSFQGQREESPTGDIIEQAAPRPRKMKTRVDDPDLRRVLRGFNYDVTAPVTAIGYTYWISVYTLPFSYVLVPPSPTCG